MNEVPGFKILKEPEIQSKSKLKLQCNPLNLPKIPGVVVIRDSI